MQFEYKKLLLSLCIVLCASCQSMDTFEDEGMMEVATGIMLVTPGISNDIRSQISSVGMFAYNSDGHTVTIADASGKAISLRDMLLEHASEKDVSSFRLLLRTQGLHIEDKLEFSGFRGTIIEGSNGRSVHINELGSATKGLEQLNLQVEGYAHIDKNNKFYVTQDIHVFMLKKDIGELLPELLKFIIVGEDGMTLADIKDDNYVLSIAKIQFNGVALTGMI